MSMQITKFLSFAALAAVAGMTAAHSAGLYRPATVSAGANIEAPLSASALGHGTLSTRMGFGTVHAQASRPSQVVAALNPDLLHHYP